MIAPSLGRPLNLADTVPTWTEACIEVKRLGATDISVAVPANRGPRGDRVRITPGLWGKVISSSKVASGPYFEWIVDVPLPHVHDWLWKIQHPTRSRPFPGEPRRF
jgi:hypothetical protein